MLFAVSLGWVLLIEDLVLIALGDWLGQWAYLRQGSKLLSPFGIALWVSWRWWIQTYYF